MTGRDAESPVLYEERDDIAIITLNRPEKKNTLTEAMIEGIANGVDVATKSQDVVAIVLRGAGDTLWVESFDDKGFRQVIRERDEPWQDYGQRPH